MTRLSTRIIQIAYEEGTFPMADEFGDIEFYSVDRRALFPMEGIHVSRSLWRSMRTIPFSISFDLAFEQVMRNCMRPGDNWINEEIIEVFCDCHLEGWAHSCEVWLYGEIVGGVYGVALGSCFCAESMFHTKTDASKIALHSMIGKCKSLGFTIFDAQVMNPHLASLGAFEVSSETYHQLLDGAMKISTPWS